MAPILTLSGITASNSGLWQTDGCHKGAGHQSAAESDVFRGFTWGFPFSEDLCNSTGRQLRAKLMLSTPWCGGQLTRGSALRHDYPCIRSQCGVRGRPLPMATAVNSGRFRGSPSTHSPVSAHTKASSLSGEYSIVSRSKSTVKALSISTKSPPLFVSATMWSARQDL